MIDSAPAWPPTSRAVSFDEFQRILAVRSDGGRVDLALNQRIAVERILVLAFGRAVLMQYAHPLIAAAVDEHSYSMNSAQGKVARFRRTMALRMQLTFGDPKTVWQAAQQIDHLHASIFGEIDSPDGAAAAKYSARDPDLIRWVHATVVDSTLLIYQKFVRTLTPGERDSYLYQASITGPLLGAGEPLFESENELRTYMDQFAASGILRCTPAAMRLCDKTLEGLPVPVVGGLANAVGRVLIRELLPPWCRELFGMKSSTAGRLFVAGSCRALKTIRPIIPKALVLWPMAASLTAHTGLRSDAGGSCPFRAS